MTTQSKPFCDRCGNQASVTEVEFAYKVELWCEECLGKLHLESDLVRQNLKSDFVRQILERSGKCGGRTC